MTNWFRVCHDITVDKIAVRQPKLAECIRAAKAQDEDIAAGYLENCGDENATGESVVWFLQHAEELCELPWDPLLLLHEFYTR